MPQNLSAADLGAPFPLKRLFLRRVLPGFLLFLLTAVGVSYLVTMQLVEELYLQGAQRQAAAVAEGAEREVTEEWQAMIDGKTLNPSQLETVSKVIKNELEELGIVKVKVYDPHRLILYSPDESLIGTVYGGAALQEMLESGKPLLEHKTEPDGSVFYEMFVPYEEKGHMVAIFELYEHVDDFDAMLIKALGPVVGLLSGLLVLIGFVLYGLVGKAQVDINQRTALINELRQRIESLVSRKAVESAQKAEAFEPEQLDCTLFFSDVRSFTAFSEAHTPAVVVDFLNRIMGLQVRIVEAHGGDVDKMIGDAVFARFQGEGCEKRALAASMEIQAALKASPMERPIGIGLYTGPVIAGGIGPDNRRDYTAIGDSVNAAARLCSAAKADQVVVDLGTYEAAGCPAGFGEVEEVSVKGKAKPLAVRRA